MKKLTRIIGFIVLLITETVIIYLFVIDPTARAACLSNQIIVFVTVWGAVGVKNVIDMKRDVKQANKD